MQQIKAVGGDFGGSSSPRGLPGRAARGMSGGAAGATVGALSALNRTATATTTGRTGAMRSNLLTQVRSFRAVESLFNPVYQGTQDVAREFSHIKNMQNLRVMEELAGGAGSLTGARQPSAARGPGRMTAFLGGGSRGGTAARGALKVTRGLKALTSAIARSGSAAGIASAIGSTMKGVGAFARVAGPVGMAVAIVGEVYNTYRSTEEFWRERQSDERLRRMNIDVLRSATLTQIRGNRESGDLQSYRMRFSQQEANKIAKATGVDEAKGNLAMAQAIARGEYVEWNWDKIRQMARAAAKSSKPDEAAAAELAKIRGWEPKKVQRRPVEYKRPAKGGA